MLKCYLVGLLVVFENCKFGQMKSLKSPVFTALHAMQTQSSDMPCLLAIS